MEILSCTEEVGERCTFQRIAASLTANDSLARMKVVGPALLERKLRPRRTRGMKTVPLRRAQTGRTATSLAACCDAWD